MSYLKPLRWWMWLFVPFSRCQRTTLKDQVGLGSQYFDIRVRYNKHKGLVFAHGLVEYKGDPFTELRKLRDMRLNCVLRIGYEGNIDEDSEAGDHFFAFVRWAKDRFNIHFIFQKNGFKVIESNDAITCLDLYEQFWNMKRIPYPIRYARKNNARYHADIECSSPHHYAMLDFIDIR
ncbi:MAG: hypothetical protein RR382_06940 [Tannerellaceae bacterium]